MTKRKTTTVYQLDKSVRPQDDFFGYANNRWLADHPIPDSEVRWGMFNVLRDNSWRNMRDIYEVLESKKEGGSVEQQARDFYYTGMHMDALAEGHKELVRRLLAEIDEVADLAGLARMLGTLHSRWITGPWYTVVDADDKNSAQHILRFCQGGLTLPDRDYYLDDADKMKLIREEYRAHSGQVYAFFPELGSDAAEVWKTVFSLEHDLAKISRTSTELRDVEANYHKTSYADLKKTYAAIAWDEYAAALGWQPNDQICINQPEFMAYVCEQLTSRSLDSWKTYLKWRVVISTYGKISSQLSELRFAFFGRVLSGTTKIMPLWKRVVLAADAAMGESVGQLYAKKHFPESSKQQVLELVEAVRTAYGTRIKRLNWMSDKTKAYALKKLAAIKVLIGYPDIWRDFSGLKITRDSYLGNYLAAAQFQQQYWLDRLHTPTSRDDWFMYPQTVNAYHDPNRLVICFPAAILQAPFFDPSTPMAANMGGIGAVIGHELTHGFDDQGCQFDAEGNVRTWQTDKERQTFKNKADIIVKQADQFKVLPDLTLKGGLVIGESIADLGGIEIALEALQEYLKRATAEIDEDLTPEALFFINYAQTQCSRTRDEKLREVTLTDLHPNAEFRVNGILGHVDAFYRQFGLKESDALYRSIDTRAHIW